MTATSDFEYELLSGLATRAFLGPSKVDIVQAVNLERVLEEDANLDQSTRKEDVQNKHHRKRNKNQRQELLLRRRRKRGLLRKKSPHHMHFVEATEDHTALEMEGKGGEEGEEGKGEGEDEDEVGMEEEEHVMAEVVPFNRQQMLSRGSTTSSMHSSLCSDDTFYEESRYDESLSRLSTPSSTFSTSSSTSQRQHRAPFITTITGILEEEDSMGTLTELSHLEAQALRHPLREGTITR